MSAAGHRRGAARRAEIADAARIVFYERGYAGTSIRAVAERAGCSLETIYRHFQSKEGLFEALVGSLRDRILEPMSGAEPGLQDSLEPEAALSHAGTALLNVLTSVEGVQVQRLAFAEVNRFPALGRLVYEGGTRHVVAVLARHLAAAHQRGRLHCPDPDEAARHFSGLLLFDPRERLLLGIEPAMPSDDVSAYAARVVSVFLDGVRPVSGQRRSRPDQQRPSAPTDGRGDMDPNPPSLITQKTEEGSISL